MIFVKPIIRFEIFIQDNNSYQVIKKVLISLYFYNFKSPMNKVFLLLVLVCTVINSFDIKINTQALLNEKPKLIDSVQNGQKLLIGDLNDPERNVLYIANLKGTPFEMGEAYGQLFKTELK